jgi:hypothetical protein
MRRIAVAIAVVLTLSLAGAPMAPATHITRSCEGGGLFATSTMAGGTCTLVLSCQGSEVSCVWDMTADVSGVGVVAGKIVNFAGGETIASCGPDFLECSATTSFALNPTGVTTVDCMVFGGERLPAVLTGVTCTATAAPHTL